MSILSLAVTSKAEAPVKSEIYKVHNLIKIKGFILSERLSEKMISYAIYVTKVWTTSEKLKYKELVLKLNHIIRVIMSTK